MLVFCVTHRYCDGTSHASANPSPINVSEHNPAVIAAGGPSTIWMRGRAILQVPG